MNTKPHIYVVIPVYNCEHLLEDAVNSVLKQPYKNISVVLVNDGSKDGSPELCDHLAQKHENIKALHQENHGVSTARNTGIEYIISINPNENDYIAFCDADDLWAKDCFDDVLLESLSRDIICFNSCEVSYDLKTCVLHNIPEFGKILPGGVASIWRYYYHFAAFIYKIQLFKQYNIRFDAKLKYDEDLIFLMQQIFLAESIQEIPRMMYLYRSNPYSAMSNRPFGIDYYIPRIKGWLSSDKKMEQYANETRGRLNGGYIFARAFIPSMAKDHYMHFGSKKELYSTLQSLDVYQDFLQFQPEPEKAHKFKELLFFQQHPNLFMLKYYFIGVFVLVYKKTFAKLRKRKYPTPNTFIDLD